MGNVTMCSNTMKSEDVHIILGKQYFYWRMIHKRYEATKKFLDQNNLLAIIRAHEAQIDGYLCFAFKKYLLYKL